MNMNNNNDTMLMIDNYYSQPFIYIESSNNDNSLSRIDIFDIDFNNIYYHLITVIDSYYVYIYRILMIIY